MIAGKASTVLSIHWIIFASAFVARWVGVLEHFVSNSNPVGIWAADHGFPSPVVAGIPPEKFQWESRHSQVHNVYGPTPQRTLLRSSVL